MLRHEFCLLLQGLVELAILQLLLFLLLFLLFLLLFFFLHSALFLFVLSVLQLAILLLDKLNIPKQPIHQLANITILILPSNSPHNLPHLPLDLLPEAPDLLIMLVEADNLREVYDSRIV